MPPLSEQVIVPRPLRTGFSGVELKDIFEYFHPRPMLRHSTPLFSVLATPKYVLPPPKSWFPIEFHTSTKRAARGREGKVISVGLVVPRAVSDKSVERSKCARKFKTALDLVVNRHLGIKGEGIELLDDREWGLNDMRMASKGVEGSH